MHTCMTLYDLHWNGTIGLPELTGTNAELRQFNTEIESSNTGKNDLYMDRLVLYQAAYLLRLIALLLKCDLLFRPG